MTRETFELDVGEERVYQIFGHRLASSFPFTRLLVPTNGLPDLKFRLAVAPPLRLERDVNLVFRSPRDPYTDRSHFELHTFGTFEVLRFTHFADFVMTSNEVTCRLYTENLRHLVEISLLGTVLAFWMERRGIPVLHASAVRANDRTIAFLGPSRAGKSTITATLTRKGCAMMTDDLLPVSLDRGRFVASPGYPEIRFWPRHAGLFAPDYTQLGTVHPTHEKLRLSFGETGGQFWGTRSPLWHMFLLDRRPPRHCSSVATIESLPPNDAVMTLVGNSFLPSVVEKLHGRKERLDFLSNLVADVPVSRVTFAEGAEHIDRVCQEIMGYIDKCDSATV